MAKYDIYRYIEDDGIDVIPYAYSVRRIYLGIFWKTIQTFDTWEEADKLLYNLRLINYHGNN